MNSRNINSNWGVNRNYENVLSFLFVECRLWCKKIHTSCSWNQKVLLSWQKKGKMIYCHQQFCIRLLQIIAVSSLISILSHWGRGHVNCLYARSRVLNKLNQLLYCVSLNIYNKFANYFCKLKFSGNTHQRP